MSEAEYLEFEKHSEVKHEYYQGEIFALAGATRNHNVIAGNVFARLRESLPEDCVPFTSDMRVKIEATGLYTYPDVVVVCGEEEYDDEAQTTLLNPVLVVEVLSDSTEAYDRGQKFEMYRTIPSLQEIVYVAQDRQSIDLFRRGEERWALYDPVDGQITLASVGDAMLSMEDVYARVEWDDEPPEEHPSH
jgi:Uma2 family endonuclease